MYLLIKKIGKYILLSDYRINCEVNFAFFCKKKGYMIIFFLLKHHLKRLRYICIGKNARVGRNLFLPHPHNIIFGDECVIGDNCTVYHDVTFGQNHWRFPVVSDGVIIYTGAKIIGDVVVGENSVIGANSVVVKSIASNSIAAGNPATIIRERRKEDKYY